MTSAVVNCSGLLGMPNYPPFEFNLTNFSSLGLFNLRSVAKYRPVELPHLGITLSPTTDTSDVVQLTIGQCKGKLSHSPSHTLLQSVCALPGIISGTISGGNSLG